MNRIFDLSQCLEGKIDTYNLIQFLKIIPRSNIVNFEFKIQVDKSKLLEKDRTIRKCDIQNKRVAIKK